MDYKKWSSMKVGDRVKRSLCAERGTIISNVGIGYVVQWDYGKKNELQMEF